MFTVPRCIFSQFSKADLRNLAVGNAVSLINGCWVELLPRPSWPKRTFSASARTEAAQSLRICRYTPSVSMDYFISQSSSHKACSSFESRTYLSLKYSFAMPASTPRISFIIRSAIPDHQR